MQSISIQSTLGHVCEVGRTGIHYSRKSSSSPVPFDLASTTTNLQNYTTSKRLSYHVLWLDLGSFDFKNRLHLRAILDISTGVTFTYVASCN